MSAVVPFRERQDSEARPLPANIEAEAALIGALLRENRGFDVVADIVAPADFSLKRLAVRS